MSAQDLAELEQARRNAALAKARVQGTAGALKQRLKPANLVATAVGGARRKTEAAGERVAGTIRKRPAATTVVAGLAALVLFRKPLKKLACRLFGKRREGGDNSPIPDATARTLATASAKQE